MRKLWKKSAKAWVFLQKSYCLHSKHVDINPGDREENCHGDLEPIGLEISNKKGYVIIFKCKKCGAIRKNKAAEDDDMSLIIELSKKHEV